MKKIIYLILSVALVLSLCITASASSDASKATLVGDSSVIVGSNIELILDVSENGADDVDSYIDNMCELKNQLFDLM